MSDTETARLHGGPMHGQQIALAEAPIGGVIRITSGMSATALEVREGHYTAVRGSPGDYEWSGYLPRRNIET